VPEHAGTPVAKRPFIPRVGEHDKPFGAHRALEKPSRALCPAHRAPLARRRELTPLRQLSQRERERERRVSDADASYNGPIIDAKTLNSANPQ